MLLTGSFVLCVCVVGAGISCLARRCLTTPSRRHLLSPFLSEGLGGDGRSEHDDTAAATAARGDDDTSARSTHGSLRADATLPRGTPAPAATPAPAPVPVPAPETRRIGDSIRGKPPKGAPKSGHPEFNPFGDDADANPYGTAGGTSVGVVAGADELQDLDPATDADDGSTTVTLTRDDNGFGLTFGGAKTVAEGEDYGYGIFVSGTKEGSAAAKEPAIVVGLQIVTMCASSRAVSPAAVAKPMPSPSVGDAKRAQ